MEWHLNYRPRSSAADIARTGIPEAIYIRLWGPDAQSQSHYDQNTKQMATDLAKYLNTRAKKDRPAWLNDMKRINRFRMEDLDGTVLAAIVPRACPYTMQQKISAREMLIDRLDKSVIQNGPPQINFVDEDDD